MSITNSDIIRVFTGIKQYIDADQSTNRINKIKRLIKTRRQYRQQYLKKNGLPREQSNQSFQTNIDKIKQQVDHKISLEQLYDKYNTDPILGLSNKQAEKRLQLFGKNKLPQKPTTNPILFFFSQVSDPFSLFLWFLVVLSLIGYGLNPSDMSTLLLSIILLITLLTGATVSYAYNKHSGHAIQSLNSFIPQYCSVIRSREIKRVRSESLVPGDIVMLQPGDSIPADIRIIESYGMRVNNSTFTGQTNSVKVNAQCTNYLNPLQSRNMVYSGSINQQGSGKGLIIATGNKTLMAIISNQILSTPTQNTIIQNEIARYVIKMTLWSLFIGLFVVTGGVIIGFIPVIAAEIAIGVTVASAPGVLNLVVTIIFTNTVKKFAEYRMIAKNLYVAQSLGSISCLCTDKTGTLTANKMTVSKIWYDSSIFTGDNRQLYGQDYLYDYNPNNPTFIELCKCGILSSIANFENSPPKQQLNFINSRKDLLQQQKTKLQDQLRQKWEQSINQLKYIDRPIIGNPTQSALIRFFQPIKDILKVRQKYPTVKYSDGNQLWLPFNASRKYSMTVVHEKSDNSTMCLYTKGAPQQIWKMCTQVLIEGVIYPKTRQLQQRFERINQQLAKNGQRVLAFSKYNLPVHKGKFEYRLQMQRPNFEIYQQVFLGAISLRDPPRKGVSQTILKMKSSGIKIIMLTGDQQLTATAIARQCNIIQENKTVNQIMIQQNISFQRAFIQSQAVVINGDQVIQMQAQQQNLYLSQKNKKLKSILEKKQVVFARTNPSQKRLIVQILQSMGHIVAVTGDGVNDSPAIKLADVGIAMMSGSDATRDAAQIILGDDNMNNIIKGIEDGRIMFDNIKKSICYVMTSQVSEFAPFIMLILTRLPIPIFTLLIDAVADFFPAISFAFEKGESDVMTRKPRNKQQHLVTFKLIGQCTGWMGISGFLACLACYYTCMIDYGFILSQLWAKGNIPTLIPDPSDTFNPSSRYYGNSKLQQIKTCDQFYKTAQSLDWINANRPWVDLRMSALVCKTSQNGQIYYQHNMAFDVCRIQQISIYTNRPVCYTTQATKYGQTAYMYGNVVCQVFNLFICKTRKDSVFTSGIDNKWMYLGLAIQYLLAIILAETMFMIILIGTRDMILPHFGFAAIPFGTVQLVVDQIRKYLIRNLPKDNQSNPNRKQQNCKPNWFQRNTLW